MGVTLIVGGQTITLSSQSAQVNLTARAATVSLTTYVPGPAGPAGPSGGISFDLPTNSDIGGNRAVATAAGYAAYADHTDLTLPAVGISMSAVSSGSDVSVQSGGKMTVTGAGWTVDGLIYAATNGTLTQTEPTTGFSQVLGRAHSADVILIDIQKPVILA